ncbi:MAG: murein biosynthesis integral membrane protein MurJ [Thermomicrobiales bacterium]
MQTTRPAARRQTPPPRPAPSPNVGAPSGRRLSSAAAIVGAAFVLSRVLGLTRDIIIGAQFGTRPEYDAYVAAFRIPDLVFLVVMSGAFGSAFVPVFAGFLERGQVGKAWRLASNVLTLMVEGFLVAAVLVLIFAGPLVRHFVAPDLSPAQQELAIELTRILLLSPLFLGLGAAAKGILEAHNNFTLPAFAPVTYNLAVVAGAIFLAPRFGVKGLAWGVVAGSIGHVATQLIGLDRVGMRFKFLPKPVADGVHRVGKLLAPRIIGQAAFQINFTIVLTAFASRLGPGHVSALNYGYQLMMLPHGLLAISVSTVIFPLMARQFVARQDDALRTTLGDALRPLFFLTLPASAALMILARPVVQTIYQRGSFSAESTALVAGALPYFAAGLVALALVETCARAFYAMQDTRTPLLASLLAIGVNIALALTLSSRFGGPGLAASMSLASTLEMLILLGVLRGRIGAFDPAVWTAFLKSLLATIIMALVLLFIQPRLIAVTTPGPGAPLLVRLALFGLAVFIGFYTYITACWYLRSRELLEFAERIGGRLRRRRRRA